MPEVVVVDTCIFLNTLDVPGFNQHRDDVLDELEVLIEVGETNLLLPMAAMIEAGNHIAHLADGGDRRKYGQHYADQVKAAILGEAPWIVAQSVQLEQVLAWLDEFPDQAMRGLGMGDLSIVKEWEAACARHPAYRVRIWSLDGGLVGFDRAAQI